MYRTSEKRKGAQANNIDKPTPPLQPMRSIHTWHTHIYTSHILQYHILCTIQPSKGCFFVPKGLWIRALLNVSIYMYSGDSNKRPRNEVTYKSSTHFAPPLTPPPHRRSRSSSTSGLHLPSPDAACHCNVPQYCPVLSHSLCYSSTSRQHQGTCT